MKIAKMYKFRLRFKGDAILPKWKGNMLRGAIGFHLRRIYCANNGACSKCNLIFKCPFGYLFRASSKGIVLRKIEGYPKPHVLKPPIEEKERYSKDDILEFSIVLFGDSAQFESDLIRAISELCKTGIGVRNKRSSLRIEDIIVENKFNGRKEVLFDGDAFYDTKTWIRDSHLEISVPRIFRLKFLTPFRILKENALLSQPEFADIFTFMLRKYSAIRYQYIRDELDINREKILERAKRIRFKSSKLKRVKFIYRKRPEEFLSGDLTYFGRTNREIRKVLAFCQLSHIGKRASFGHGWYEIE